MSLKLNTASGGSITLQEADTASNLTLTVPAQAGTVLATNSSGNVGINTTTPAVRLNGKTLSINGTESSQSYQSGIELLNNGASAGELFASSIEMVLNAYYNKDLNFRTNNTVRGTFDTSGNFKYNSGYGSVATAYGCRAWVNFNGTGTVAIRASGNVSSITDNNTGDYTVNFSTALPDANYSVNLNGTRSTVATNFNAIAYLGADPTTAGFRFSVNNSGGTALDSLYTTVSVFR
jgi:hypothetical protein